MYRKDYFLNETQRLAQLIAKLMGLKHTPDQEQQVKQFYTGMLADEYQIEPAQLEQYDIYEFTTWLKQANFSAAKLDALAQLLYHEAEPFQADKRTLLQLQKALAVFDLLEQVHHVQSFENIGKRQVIQQYINHHHA